MLIRPGNTKLGEVPCFSILAGATCPGKTAKCVAHCYAMKRFFKMPNVLAAHSRHWEATKQSDFADKMIDEIRQLNLVLLRIHVAGDFYDAPYVRKWIEIVESCPEVTFYAYTRSWRVQKMQLALKHMALLPNFQLWWSADSDTHALNGRPPVVEGVKIAYMQSEHGEEIPSYTDLIFRVKRKDLVVKYLEGHLVCPAEQGIYPKPPCEKCRLCFNGRDIPQKLLQLS